jgi:hypothetical protein
MVTQTPEKEGGRGRRTQGYSRKTLGEGGGGVEKEELYGNKRERNKQIRKQERNRETREVEIEKEMRYTINRETDYETGRVESAQNTG